MQVFSNFCDVTIEQIKAIEEINFKPAPNFLGNFGISYYGHPYGRGKKIPSALIPLAEKMASVHPEQNFNASFIQRYPVGSFVSPHRDPKNNVGYTLILVLGEFVGATSIVQGYQPIALNNGDMMSLECTINDIQGPRHQVTTVTRGTRYALILNTCI